MNEKIKKLAEQFRMNFSINGNPQDGIHWDDVDEFAQLIIKECVGICDNVEDEYLTKSGCVSFDDPAHGAYLCSYKITKHFGEEE